MTEVKKYLDKHKIKNYGWCVEYDSIKSATIGSLPHRITFYKDKYFLFGKPLNETFD